VVAASDDRAAIGTWATTLFCTILSCNLLGLMPFNEAPTSGLGFSTGLGVSVWATATILGFYKLGITFPGHFIPGTVLCCCQVHNRAIVGCAKAHACPLANPCAASTPASECWCFCKHLHLIQNTSLSPIIIAAMPMHTTGGTPWPMAFIFVPLETISYTFRAVSLGVRLWVNMLAGHTLLHILTGG
jgi:F0F1-type ATP synthase membrane subunit a